MNESINWEKATLGSISLVDGQYGANEPAVSLMEGNARYIRITDIDDDGHLINEGAVGANIEKIEHYTVNYNDLLFARTGATTGKCYIHRDKNGVYTFAGFLIKFKIDESKADPYYIWSLTKTKKYSDWVKTMSVRSGQPGINSKEYSNLEITLPPLAYQKKITHILSTWDEAIFQVDSLISEYQNQYDSIVNLILKKKDIYSTLNRWHEVLLGELITEVSEKTRLNDQYPVLTSSRKGIFLQEEYFKKSVSSSDNTGYKIIRNGEFTFRAMSDDGSFKFNRLEDYPVGIVSPAYSVFKATKIEPRFLNLYMNSHTFTKEIAKSSQGGTRLSLKYKALSNFKISIPSFETQSKISDFFDVFRKHINQYRLYKVQLKKQKEGLMQQLLTGKIRVNVN